MVIQVLQLLEFHHKKNIFSNSTNFCDISCVNDGGCMRSSRIEVKILYSMVEGVEDVVDGLLIRFIAVVARSCYFFLHTDKQFFSLFFYVYNIYK
jgi:hypothetical protein